jgi:hypothetical protein
MYEARYRAVMPILSMDVKLTHQVLKLIAWKLVSEADDT